MKTIIRQLASELKTNPNNFHYSNKEYLKQSNMSTKIEVRKHLDKTVLDINGNVVREEYYYTIAVRTLFCFWQHLKFYTSVETVSFNEETEDMVIRSTAERCLLSNEVSLSADFQKRFATHFKSEADANMVKDDMLQHPEKYVFIS